VWLLDRLGRTGLDPKWVITPVGGIDKVPAFAALFWSLEERGFRKIGYDMLNGYFVDTRSQQTGLRLP
jgi:hypothetical protein